MAREEALPCELGVDAQRDAVTLVSADITIETVRFALGEMRRDPIPERVETLGVDRLVGVIPVNELLAGRLADEELIFRGAPSVRAGIHDQLTVGSKHALAARDRVLDQLGCGEILPKFDDFQFFRKRKN